MALKRLKTKKSKRLTGKLKHKIEKKVREHNRKARREAKKNPKTNKKRKMIHIPKVCPFRDEILSEVAVVKGRQAKQQEASNKQNQISYEPFKDMLDDAKFRENLHSKVMANQLTSSDEITIASVKKEQSFRKYFKEFKKVIENADVLLEVVDARDPLGTRCVEVDRAISELFGNKKLVLVLNKADLVPRENLDSWLRYFRRYGPVTAFKASTQEQTTRLGHRRLYDIKNDKDMQSSICIGAELLMSMLGNYCRNKGIKTAIRVGVVGIPNVGKSSIINSLIRGRSCMVGSTPGVTKKIQEVELDSKIKLIDCPGIVFGSINKTKTPLILKNAQRITDIKDPFTMAENVLKRASKEYFCKLYDITNYTTFDQFFAKKATRMGKFLKKGIPDVEAAARSVLNDWNSGKIRFYTQPPELDEPQKIHISSSIIPKETQEFDVDNFDEMKQNILENLTDTTTEGIISNLQKLDQNRIDQNYVQCMKRKIDNIEKRKTHHPVLLLPENMLINKKLKELQKKKRKQNARTEKKILKVTNDLNSFGFHSPSA